jgi:hypothetical protein
MGVNSTANQSFTRLTYEAKCVSKSGEGLICRRIHSHGRELVDASREPCAKYLKCLARGLRLSKKLSGEASSTLWSQSKFTTVVRKHLSQLIYLPQFARCCPCGHLKLSQWTAIKIDAAQFFKSASFPRGTSRASFLLGRLQQQGFSGIGTKKEKRQLENSLSLAKSFHPPLLGQPSMRS